MSYRGKAVLVTGADGFIGSHLAEALAQQGGKVTALSLYTGADRHGWLDEIDPELRATIRIVRGDIRDAAMMHRLLTDHEIVFHLAALIAIPYSYEAPLSYIDVNVAGTANILEAARNHGTARIVHTSTSEVYGTAQTIPIMEGHPLVAQSPYAASKIAADKLAQAYALSFDLPVAILRPFNTYGPRQSERAVISSIIRQALDPNCEAIRVGTTAPIRDFTYVADTVKGFLAIGTAERIEFGAPYNAGTGQGASIGDVIDYVREITCTNKPILSEEQRLRPIKSDVQALIADASNFYAATGWKPSLDIHAGLKLTVDWWRERIASGRVREEASYIF